MRAKKNDPLRIELFGYMIGNSLHSQHGNALTLIQRWD